MITIVRTMVFEGVGLLLDEGGDVWSFQGSIDTPTIQRIETLSSSSLGPELYSEATTRKMTAAWDRANGR